MGKVGSIGEARTLNPPFVERAIKRLERLISEADGREWHTQTVNYGDRIDYNSSGFLTKIPNVEHHQFRAELPVVKTRIAQAVRDIAPNTEYSRQLESGGDTDFYRNIAFALCSDLKAGDFNDAHDLAHAEVFSDFLDMAEYLLSKRHKDAAAVIAGSAHESHLRCLALKKIPAYTGLDQNGKPLNGNTLNADMARAQVYGAIESKSITAWQAIRNEAAHGNYDKYDSEQVKNMISGIKSFITNHPA